MSLITRTGKGSKLTIEEMDGNLEYLASSSFQEGVYSQIIGSGAIIGELNDTITYTSPLANAAVASERYAESASKATDSLNTMSQQYAATAKAMEGMSNAAVDAAEYHTQVQNVTKNLSSLNAVYEMELQDANSHLKAMNKFHGNLSAAMQNMADASKDTEQFKHELAKLSTNLSQLNKVYGNMLTAMKGQ